jgi:two-component system LytT family response regulator
MICLKFAMTHLLKTIIVDDEALARRGLKLRLSRRNDIEVAAEAKNGREALALIRELKPDLVFLDIQMPGMDGFDVLRALQPDEMPAIVFVTAFDNYAIQAFGAHALDYLLKPIEDDRLADALDRVKTSLKQRRAIKHRNSLLKLVADITGEPVRSMAELSAKGLENLKKKEVPKLAIRDGSHTTWIPQDKIEWIDAAGDYMCVHSGGATHIMRMTMKKLEESLDPDYLHRVHRSTIVNIHQVKEMHAHINGEYFLTLKGGHTIKMSRTYKDKLKLFN